MPSAGESIANMSPLPGQLTRSHVQLVSGIRRETDGRFNSSALNDVWLPLCEMAFNNRNWSRRLTHSDDSSASACARVGKNTPTSSRNRSIQQFDGGKLTASSGVGSTSSPTPEGTRDYGIEVGMHNIVYASRASTRAKISLVTQQRTTRAKI